MAFDQQAKDDFERAAGRAFWRKILTLFTGANNEPLPFDEVRKRLTICGIIERLWYLKESYGEEVPIERAAEQFVEDASQRPVRRVVKAIKKVTGKK
jgi:hypothetical protein